MVKIIASTPQACRSRSNYAGYYLSNEEYYSRYKEFADEHRPHDSEDQLIYEGRAVPFQVIGGAFISKLYRFAETEDARLSADDLSEKPARLCLSVNNDEWSVTLKLPHLDSSQFNYVWIDNEQLPKKEEKEEKCLVEAGAK